MTARKNKSIQHLIDADESSESDTQLAVNSSSNYQRAVEQYKQRWESFKKSSAKNSPTGVYQPNLQSREAVAQMLGRTNEAVRLMFDSNTQEYQQGKVPKESFEPFIYEAKNNKKPIRRTGTPTTILYDLNACMAWRLDNEAAAQSNSKNQLTIIKTQREQLELMRELELYVPIADVNNDLVPKMAAIIEKLYYGVETTFLMTNGTDVKEGLKKWYEWLDKITLDAKNEWEDYARRQEKGEKELAAIEKTLDVLE